MEINETQSNKLLQTGASGLTTEEVAKRKKAGLGNEASQAPNKSIKKIISEHVFTPFNLLNLALFCIVLFVSFSNIKYLVNGLFFLVAVINTLGGIIQELKARKEVRRLSLINQPCVYVIRDGTSSEIPTTDLVVGDLIELYPDNQIVVDAKYLSGINFQVDESLLTGESDPVEKSKNDPLYSGSFVITGRARAIVTKTGLNTYAAQISKETQKIKKPDSEIKIALNNISKLLGVIILIVGTAMLISKIFIQKETPIQDVLISTVAAMIGMIPEGLVLLNFVAAVLGVIQLSKKNILVQRMSTIETLARIDTLCLDKTGTITTGEMFVENVNYLSDISKSKTFSLMQRAFISLADNNNTSKAILKYLEEQSELFDNNLNKELSKSKIEKHYSFSSQYKWSGVKFSKDVVIKSDSTNSNHRAGNWIFGAPEFVLSKEQLQKFQKYIDRKTAAGTRLLVVAQTNTDITHAAKLPQDLNIICFFEIEETIREHAKATFDYFAKQDVNLIIISGDNPVTVKSIANKAGISQLDKAIDMSQISDDEDYYKLVKEYQMFGRVTPFQKQKLIKALQDNGHVVGMAGDGINDVPAFKIADCSVAIASGSDAAKASADIVLSNNDLSEMIPTVCEGRRIINNIERAAVLFLTKTTYMSLLAFLFIFIDQRFPLFPIQMTLLGSGTIGIPGFFLSLMPNNRRVEKNFLKRTMSTAFPAGVTATIVVLLHQFNVQRISMPIELGSTITLYILLLISLSVLWLACRPFNKYTISIWLFSLSIVLIAIFFFPDLFFLQRIGINGIKYMLVLLGVILILFYSMRKISNKFIFSKIN